MLPCATVPARLIWKRLFRRSGLSTLRPSATWSIQPRKHSFAITYRPGSSARSSGSAPWPRSPMPGKRERLRPRWLSLVKRRGGTPTRRSSPPGLSFLRTLFDFACNRSVLASTCWAESYGLPVQAHHAHPWWINMSEPQKPSFDGAPRVLDTPPPAAPRLATPCRDGACPVCLDHGEDAASRFSTSNQTLSGNPLM